MTLLLLAFGLVALFFGGEALVRGAVALARHAHLSPLVIGMTVVGFGTSMPEMVVSVQAALAGTPAIAIGNVVGSNIANVLLILGLSALVFPIRIDARTMGRELAFMLAATAALAAALAGGMLSRPEALAMLAALAAYLWLCLRGTPTAPDTPATPPMRLWPAIGLTLAGLVALILGARALVDAAVAIARAAGLSEAVIGLTIVAVGTSLPELATSVIAALRRQSEIAVGNVVGSNLFNILGILGLTAALAPIPAEPRFLRADLPVAALAALALVVALYALRGLPRWAGLAMLIGYAVYGATLLPAPPA
ncbi:MAG: calcium/sodium antiporter [Paracoccaceae bacterium]